MNGIDIIYEDNHILVAIKPPNMPSQADSSGDADILTLLKGYIKDKYNKPGNVYLGLIHRLDRPASGLMLFARTSKAAARLSEQMRERRIEKRYLARVNGQPEPPDGEWADYLRKHDDGMVRLATENEPDAKLAKLAYQTLESGPHALVGVDLFTGRSHQIRVQFAARGLPLLGDARYGSGGRQLALWSYRLAFEHPVKHEWLSFVHPPPDGLLRP